MHEDEAGADDRARMMLDIYKKFAEEYLAIPAIPGVKSESEKFAGALRTYTIEAMMQDGKALQFGTSHNLGQNFAKVFDVGFLDKTGERQFAWQTSWGVSTRMIGGLIMAHSDDKGLVLPPKIASIQAIITTIFANDTNREEINNKAEEIRSALQKAGILAKTDVRDLRPGEKYFEWEQKGVPVRIELGPKDMEAGQVVLVRRDTGVKETVKIDEVVDKVSMLLSQIQACLFETALARQKEKTKTVDSWDEFVTAIEEGYFVLAHWNGDTDVEASIKEETGATIRCIPFSSEAEEGVCVKSGKKSERRVLFAKAY